MPKNDKPDRKPSKRDHAGANAKQKQAAEQREREGASASQAASHAKSKFLRGDRIEPKAITGAESAIALISGLLKSEFYFPDVTPITLRLDPGWDPLLNDPRFRRCSRNRF